MDESLPPKPKALHTMCLSDLSSGPTCGTTHSGSGVLQLSCRGTKPCCMARRQKTALMEPEALVVCPVKGLVDDTGGTAEPKIRLIAALSEVSLLGVPVPWAFT